MKVVHFSHHKCATRWISAMLEEIGLYLGLAWGNATNPEMWACRQNDYLNGKVDLISFSNANYSLIDPLDDLVGFHIYRDPRDILVSSYFSSLKTHASNKWPELQPHREQLKELNKEQGLILEIDFIRDVFEALATWNYDDPRILEVRLEDLMKDNYTGLLAIASHVGLVNELDTSTSAIGEQTRNHLNLLRNRVADKSRVLNWLRSNKKQVPVLYLLGIIHRNRFTAKADGRYPGSEDLSSHYRKGVAGDWRNHFSPLVEEEFKARWGDLVVKLGYEKNSDWSFAKTF